MAAIAPTCACPTDSKWSLLAKVNNNLVLLFNLMSSDFVGQTVSLTGGGVCLCSELQILAILNNNVASFFSQYEPASGAGVDLTITSLSDLAAVTTTDLTPPQAKVWIKSADGTLQVWKLMAGTDATGDGVQRPDDYNGATNAKVWYQVAT